MSCPKPSPKYEYPLTQFQDSKVHTSTEPKFGGETEVTTK